MDDSRTYQNEAMKKHLNYLLFNLKRLTGESLEYDAFEHLVDNAGTLYSADVIAERLIRRIEKISKIKAVVSYEDL